MTVVNGSCKQDFYLYQHLGDTGSCLSYSLVYNSQVICEKQLFFTISFFKLQMFKYAVFTGSSRTCGLQFKLRTSLWLRGRGRRNLVFVNVSA